MKKKNSTPSDWTDKAVRVQSRRCLSCEPPWGETIRECLVAMAADYRPEVTFAALHRWLRDPENFEGEPYPNTMTALLYHIRGHEPELYREVVARGAK